MVNSSRATFRTGRSRGSILIEAAVAVSILTAIVIPLGFLMNQERAACRSAYYHAIAMEIVDGEIEILAAGEWREFKYGAQDYSVTSRSAANLPPGRFVLTIDGKRLSLEWIPSRTMNGGRVAREVRLQ